MADDSLTVTFVSDRQPSVSIRLTASVEDRGLVLSGQDVGPLVNSIWGDSDYEFWLVVIPSHLTRILDALVGKLDHETAIPEEAGQRDRLLLELLQEAWSRGVFQTDVDFRRWLDAIDVPSEFSSYV